MKTSAPLLAVLTTILFGFSLSGCGGGGVSAPEGGAAIEGSLTNCFGDSIFLWEMNGQETKRVASAALVEGGEGSEFALVATNAHEGFYQIGTGPRSRTVILLGGESNLTFTGDCFDMNNTGTVEGSALNAGYKEMTQFINNSNKEVQQLVQQLQTFQFTNPGAVPGLQQQLAAAQAEKKAKLDSFAAQGGLLGKVASLNNFTLFDPARDGATYGNEPTYFRKTFFSGIDVADPAMAHIPQFGDRFRQYAINLAQMGIPKEDIKQSVDELLAKMESGGENYRAALGGLIAGFDQTKSDLYITYGEAWLAAFPGPTAQNQAMEARINELKRFAMGATPPDITLPDPNGKNLSLSSLRGNYVMIDFWASWCRPCRAENPNVVRLYKKYHPQGFEILGVSLDKEKNAWTTAIAQDGLTWKHVSDLQAWQSQAAASYGVNSIPMTFLLDKEGKIIGKNLRGAQLEAKLAELFNS